MKASFASGIAGFACLILAVAPAASAGGKRQFIVFDNHPTGGAAATGKSRIFNEGDPAFQVEGPGKCGELFLGGTFLGHPDPRIKDPTAVCGHGQVIRYFPQVHPGARPLLILPITAPVAPTEGGATQVVLLSDASRVVQEQLPRLDRSDGDDVPAVLEMRAAIRSSDVAKAAKHTPRPMAKSPATQPVQK